MPPGVFVGLETLEDEWYIIISEHSEANNLDNGSLILR